MSKPIIGITCDYDYSINKILLAEGYYRAISEAGGFPFLIAYTSQEDIGMIMDVVDGIMFTGGGDVDPSYFGEMSHPKLGSINPIRDEMEIQICRRAMEMDIPVLGICRGIQIINVAMGGTLYQDLESQWEKGPLQKHSQGAPDWYGTHDVLLEEGSKIQKIMGVSSLSTNSFHHQAVWEPAPGFCVTGRSRDGVVEVLESAHHRFAIGVQWHPERMWERDHKMRLLFAALVEACK